MENSNFDLPNQAKSFTAEQETQIAPIVQLAQLNHVDVAKTIIAGLEDGLTEPMRVHLFLKRVEKLSELVLKNENVKQIILNDAEKHITKGSSFEYLGAKCTVQAVYTWYDFEATNDPVWVNLKEIEERVKKMRTDREAFLKAAFPDSTNSLYGSPNPKVLVDHLYSLELVDCGEEIALSRPIKRQTRGVKTSFPKV